MSKKTLRKILEVEANPKKAILELDKRANQHDEVFITHTKENHEEHVDLYGRIENISLTPGEKGDAGIDGTDGLDGKDGKHGKDGKNGLDGKNGPQGVQGIPGKDGKDGEDGLNGIDGDNGKDGETPKHEWKGTAIRFKNPDGTWGEWKNLQGKDGERGRRAIGYGSASSTSSVATSQTTREDLSAQCDGANLVFTLPSAAETGTVQLWSTQFPIVYRPVVDFVETDSTTITLQSGEVGAPQTGQTLIALYTKA